MTGKYRTIVADPPWPYDGGFWTTSHNARTGSTWDAKRKTLPYASMPLADIAALPVDDLAAADAFLFLWTTNRYLEGADARRQAPRRARFGWDYWGDESLNTAEVTA